MSDAETVADSTETAALHQVARSATARLVILTGFIGIADFAFGAVYVDVLLRAGLTPASIGIGFFAAFAVSTLVEIPSGDWGDRWGQRRLAVIGLMLWGAALVVFAIAQDAPVVLLATLVLWSVGQALFSGAPISLTINAISPSLRDLRLRALRAANVAKWVGSAAGGLAVFVGVLAVDAHVLIGVAGGILIILAVWVRLGWPEAERFAPRESERRLWQRLRAGWTSTLGPLLVMTMLASALLSVLLFAWQPLVAQTTGLPVSANGGVLFVMTVIAALGAWLTRFRDKLRGGWDTGITLAVIAAIVLFAGAIPGVVSTVLALSVVELLTSYCLTALAMDAHGVFDDRYRNMLWSVFSAAMGVAMAVTDLVFGLLWDALGLTPALAWAGAIGLGLVVITVVAQQVINFARTPR